MSGPRSKFLGLAVAFALSGCSYANNALDWASDSFTGSSSDTTTTATSTSTSSGGTTVAIAPSRAESNPLPTINAAPLPSGGFVAAPATTGTTFVGMKVAALKAEYGQFQGNLAQHQQELQAIRQAQGSNGQAYFNTIAAINARLQVGTTPGNPQLVAQWGQAQSTLDRMNSDVARLNALSNSVASDSSFGNYLLNEVRSAYSLQGGIDSDRDQLRQVENQTIAGLTTVNQLLNNLGDEIGRQSGYIANERNNLVTLALAIQNGQLYGPSLANRNFAQSPSPAPAIASAAPAPRPAPRPAAPRASAPTSSIGSEDRPLVVIRFDQPNVDYEQPLYTAVSRALERKPSATFTIQAVAPNAGSAADVAVNTNASRQNAENVLRSLTSMGLPADRVSLAATMSPDIQSSEVRIFVR